MRRPVVAVVALAAIAGSAAIGWVAASQIRSPEQLALEAQPPEPSAITVPIERRVLSADVVTRGTVRFDTPATVSLAAPPADGSAAVVTRLPERGDTIEEGEVLLQVSGRPVLVLDGLLPMYRDLELRSVGDDMFQLEVALTRLGYRVGEVDGTYDAMTADAVVQWYADSGFPALGPTEEEADALRAAQDRVRAAESAVRDAEAQLREAGEPPERSVQLAARSAVRQAADQVAAADAAAAEALATARADAAAAALALTQARQALAQAETDPEGDPATIQEARAVVVSAEAELDRANRSVGTVAVRNAADTAAARDSLELAQAQLEETLAAPDTALERAAVDAAVQERTAARQQRDQLIATTGITVPASEVVFLTGLPLRVDAIATQLGAEATGDLMALAGSRQAIDSSVTRADVPLLEVDMPVVIEAEQLGITVPGTISRIAEEPGTNDLDAQRHFVEIVPDEFLEELRDASVRITIPVESTDGEVLVVPVAALSASSAGTARVELAGPSGDLDDLTVVEVRTGLSSGGMVEIEALDGSLSEGDRVVVGADG